MNWLLAIDRNRTALLTVVAAIVALLGGREAASVSRRLRNAALALLRPAESAARRLIVIAARDLVVAPGPARPPPQAGVFGRGATAGGLRTPAFRLFDRRKRFTLKLPVAPPRGVPRIRTFWSAPAQPVAIAAPPPPRPDPDAPVDAGRLRRRLAALEAALADLPRQARRLSRRLARLPTRPGAAAPSPLRFGRPPGFRKGSGRDIDRVLAECHAFALDAARPDTS